MSNTWFQFKQFKIEQALSAMKVGTDGVLLGAWTDVNRVVSILDIGTGTGLIALMLAQRCDKALIDAVELDKDAHNQATQNFLNTKWSNRLQCFNSSIQNFNTDKKYDLIVSNPPFFENSFLAKGDKRNLARHNVCLKPVELLKHVTRLLKKGGRFTVILPFINHKVFIEEAFVNCLYLNKICNIYPTDSSNIKRVLLEFSFNESNTLEEKLTIEPFKRHEYSQEYINLTKAFYLNF